MLNILSNEEVLCSIKASKNIKTSTMMANIFANLISMGTAGRVTNDFKLNLTNENLYIEATSYSTWGGLPETIYMEKILREDIKVFEVKKQDTEEIITITTKDDKIMTLIRNNKESNNLALRMAKLIENDK